MMVGYLLLVCLATNINAANDTDLLECTANSARANSSAECECNSGYKEWGEQCANVNECVDSADTGVCGPDEECFDTEGSYTCMCNSCWTRGKAGACSVHVYSIYNETLLWPDAQLFCAEKDQMLAKVNSQEDHWSLYDAIRAEFGFSIAPSRWNNSNWLWIGATDEVTQGIYLFTDGDQLTFDPPWAKKQEPEGDNWQRSKTSGPEDHLAVSRWGTWDDSFGKIHHRPFACSC